MANRWGSSGNSDRFLFSWAQKWLKMVTAAMKLKDTCCLEEKLWHLDSILKSRDITLTTKVHLVKAMVFPVVMYGCENWTIKKAECQRIELGKTLESPLDCKEIQPVHPKGNSVLNIHWKDWCWSWSSHTMDTWHEELTHWKRPWCWERLRAGGEGDEMVGWHHQLDGHEFEHFVTWWWTRKPGVL